MIRINDVSFSYDGSADNGIRRLSLEIAKGECVVLCGRSGCGKTTVTRLINGLIPHYFAGDFGGSVEVGDMKIEATPMHEIAASVGSVFQNPRSQFFNVDTDSEIVFGLENRSVPTAELRSALDRTTDDLGLGTLRGRSIFELSGGEKQKIALASVYSMSPDVYVLDEPSSNLDTSAIAYLRGILEGLKADGKTIVIAEHRLYYLAGLADRYMRFDSGVLAETLSASQMDALSGEEQHKMGLRRGTLSDLSFAREDRAASEVMLEVEDLSLKVERRTIATGVSLSASRGDVVGVIGLNGSGKSTFVRALCGLHKKARGTIRWDQRPMRPRQRRSIGYLVFQDVNYQLFADSVLEESHFGLKDPDVSLAEQTLKELDLYDERDRHPASLSGGQKQRTAIAVSLNCGRELLVFDEPSSGLDYDSMIQFARLVRDLARDGKVILIVTHDFELLSEVCTRIAWFTEGTSRAIEPGSAAMAEVKEFFAVSSQEPGANA